MKTRIKKARLPRVQNDRDGPDPDLSTLPESSDSSSSAVGIRLLSLASAVLPSRAEWVSTVLRLEDVKCSSNVRAPCRLLALHAKGNQ